MYIANSRRLLKLIEKSVYVACEIPVQLYVLLGAK